MRPTAQRRPSLLLAVGVGVLLLLLLSLIVVVVQLCPHQDLQDKKLLWCASHLHSYRSEG